MTPVSTPVEAVPDEVRELLQRVAIRLRQSGLYKDAQMADGVEALMADRAIRPASPPRADAGEVAWRISAAERDADDVSASITAGKRINRGRVEDLRNHVRFLIAQLRATQPAEAVRASQEERDRIAEDERDRLYRKANADYIEAETRGDKIAEDLHSTAAFWLGENGGKSEADRAAARQAHRDQPAGDGK